MFDYTLKLIIVGDASTGKTSLTHRYLSGVFVESPRLTIGVDFFTKKIKLSNGKKLKLQIWDFAGEERYRFLLPTYSKGSHGALILYDISMKKTINNIQEYVQIIKENAGNIPIMLIGSKADLEEHREVPTEEGINLAKQNRLSSFSEISSKTNFNVEDSLKNIVNLMLNFIGE